MGRRLFLLLSSYSIFYLIIPSANSIPKAIMNLKYLFIGILLSLNTLSVLARSLEDDESILRLRGGGGASEEESPSSQQDDRDLLQLKERSRRRLCRKLQDVNDGVQRDLEGCFDCYCYLGSPPPDCIERGCW